MQKGFKETCEDPPIYNKSLSKPVMESRTVWGHVYLRDEPSDPRGQSGRQCDMMNLEVRFCAHLVGK